MCVSCGQVMAGSGASSIIDRYMYFIFSFMLVVSCWTLDYTLTTESGTMCVRCGQVMAGLGHHLLLTVTCTLFSVLCWWSAAGHWTTP